MTARPWGTTGRVTVRQYIDTDGVGHADYDVLLDGENVGRALCVSANGEWEASEPYSMPTTLPDLDAAVRWVIRRADADVWRQERGPVVRIRRNSRRLWWGYRNDGLVVASGSTWPRAMAAVRTYLSEATP